MQVITLKDRHQNWALQIAMMIAYFLTVCKFISSTAYICLFFYPKFTLFHQNIRHSILFQYV